MKAWLLAALRRVLYWLERNEPLDLAADIWVQKADQLGVDRGEYKRHWATTRLHKQFPDARRRDMAMAIERAVQRKA